jgi:hypothetical protein
VAEEVGRDRRADERGEEEEDDEPGADDRELVPPEPEQDAHPVTAGLDLFQLGYGAARDLNRRRSVDPYRHDRGEGTSKQDALPRIRSSMTLRAPDC